MLLYNPMAKNRAGRAQASGREARWAAAWGATVQQGGREEASGFLESWNWRGRSVRLVIQCEQ